MTSFAFILGVTPLLVTTGAGAEMRKTLGTAVFSGMLGVTLFGIFLTPVFFYVIAGFADSPLLASERIRLVGRGFWWGLTAVTLGIPWLLGRMTSSTPCILSLPAASPLISKAQNVSHRHQTLLSGSGSFQGVITCSTVPMAAILSLKVEQNHSKGLELKSCWLLQNTSIQK